MCSRALFAQVSELEEGWRQKERTFCAKLATTEDAHRDSLLELRKILTSQQRHSAHCKEEYEQMSARMESRLKEMTDELQRARLRQDQLVQTQNATRQSLVQVNSCARAFLRTLTCTFSLTLEFHANFC